jgi:hypothetical protein
MDPIHHEKIVDKLMQYRGKIPKGGQLADKNAEYFAEMLRKHIDFIIGEIEWFADSDQKGLIR